MSVAIYSIFRDEAAHVAQWAETTLDADYRYVLDTGSTDGTLEELDLHGIAFGRVTIDPFRFDDARNMALAVLPPTIEWCLQLDADEVLSPLWRSCFEAVVDRRIRRYRYRWENHGTPSWGLVMRSNLHARHGFRWRYPCHEVLEPQVPTIDVPLMVVEHHPDPSKPREYLGLLAAGAREEPGDHRMAFYLARELHYVGHWTAARAEFERFLALGGGWPPERAEAYRHLAAIDDHPERWLWRAVGECPARREPWCDLARLYLGQGRGDEARAVIELAAARDDETIYTTSRDCWGEAFEALREECAALV